MSAKDSMLQALEADKSNHTLFLQQFVRAASPNPPGDTAAAAKVVAEYLKRKGIPHEEITAQQAPGRPNIVSEFSGQLGPGPRVVLNGHMDVFPVGNASDWDRDPWSGDIAGDRIYGRGVVDMKSGTASLLIAYAYLFENRQFLTGSVAFCGVSDEETGGKWGTKYLLQEDQPRWGGDVMLDAEPGGCGTVRISEKGTLRMTCTVKTRGALGSYLNLSKGAIRTATSFISKVIDQVEGIHVDTPDDQARHVAEPEVRKAIDDAMGPGTAEIILRPTVNVGTIRGGVKVNMIPENCVFELDIRLPIGLKRDRVLAIMDAIVKEYEDAAIDISVHEAASNPSSFSSIKHPMINLLADNAKSLEPEQDRPVAIPSMGATDCKHYRYAGVPAYVYGCSPMSSK